MNDGAKNANAFLSSIVEQIMTNEEDWEPRSAALQELSNHFNHVSSMDESNTHSKFPPPEALMLLIEPFRMTLRDLRSSIVKDACLALRRLGSFYGIKLKLLLRDIFPVLLEIRGTGNRVSTSIELKNSSANS